MEKRAKGRVIVAQRARTKSPNYEIQWAFKGNLKEKDSCRARLVCFSVSEKTFSILRSSKGKTTWYGAPSAAPTPRESLNKWKLEQYFGEELNRHREEKKPPT